MDDAAFALIALIVLVGILLFGGYIGSEVSTNNLSSTQYTQAQDKCKEHEGVYSVGVMKDKVKVFCKNNVEFVLEKK